VPLGWGDNAGTTFGGHRHLKILEGKKTSKIWCDVGKNFTLTANISGTHRDIDKW